MSERRTPVLRRQIMRYICEYYEDTGCMPGYRQIGAAVGLSSPASVGRHITALREEGMLKALPSGRLLPSMNRADVTSEPQRYRLKLANGGQVMFDCHFEIGKNSPTPQLIFDGIMETVGLTGEVSRIIGCEIEEA